MPSKAQIGRGTETPAPVKDAARRAEPSDGARIVAKAKRQEGFHETRTE